MSCKCLACFQGRVRVSCPGELSLCLAFVSVSVVVVSFLPVLFWKCTFLLCWLPCHFLWDDSNLSDVFCVCSLLFSSTCLYSVPIAHHAGSQTLPLHANFVLRFCNYLLWYFVLRNCCSVDFFILISCCLASFWKDAFLQCVPSYVIFICIVLLHNVDCLLSHALMFRSKSVMTNLFIFQVFSVGVLLNHSDVFFLNANVEHCHPPLITHCCPVTVWMKAVHCWLAIFLTD